MSKRLRTWGVLVMSLALLAAMGANCALADRLNDLLNQLLGKTPV